MLTFCVVCRMPLPAEDGEVYTEAGATYCDVHRPDDKLAITILAYSHQVTLVKLPGRDSIVLIICNLQGDFRAAAEIHLSELKSVINILGENHD